MNQIKGISRGLSWLTAVGMTGLMAACGGGGQSSILGAGSLAPVLLVPPPVIVVPPPVTVVPPPVTVVPPTVTVVSPTPGATGVATNTKRITAGFSKAMDSATLNATSFTLVCPLSAGVSGGAVSYLASTRVATLTVPAAFPVDTCTATVTTAAKDSTGVALASNYAWQFSTSGVADTTPPTVAPVSPLNGATNVATNSPVKALFNETMDPLTITTSTFTLSSAAGLVAGTVALGPLNKNATFKPNANLTANTLYTATITTASTDLAGNALVANEVWTFTTAATVALTAGVDLNTAAPFGTFGGTAGMTNTGTLTIVNGDIGTIATGTSMVTGFHENAPGNDIYTETPANIGAVTGTIYTCTNSTTGANSAGPSAPECAIATQARLDAQTAYLELVAMPVVGASPAPGGNLASLTLLPGVYKSAAGSFMIQGGDLTLDAQGDANAIWVFQMATTLSVGGPGAAAPQSIILTNGALAKNVFWQVGSFATINAAGGGTMVGTIIAQSGAAFSTAGNVNVVTLNGRALSLGASVTLVDTVINVPAP